jgi:hypothetical protein
MKAMAWLILAASLWGLQDKDPKAEFEKKFTKAKSDAAKEHARIADYLDVAKMHKWARGEDERAMKLNPENENARKRLGYKKEGDTWVKDPGANVERENKKKGADETRIRGDYDAKLASLAKEAAKDFYECGLFARKHGLDSEAQEAFGLCLEYEPDNEKAHKELGHEKGPSGWMTKADKAQKEAFKGEVGKAPKGEPDKEATEFEKGLELKHEHRKSPKAFIESPHMDQKKLERMIQLCEHTQAMFARTFKSEPPPKPLHLVILKEKKHHEIYIDKFFEGTAEIKKLMKGTAGSQQPEVCRAQWWQSTHPDAVAEDWVVHYTCHLLTYHLLGDHGGGKRPWLHEAIAYYFTVEVLDSIKTYCVNFAGTGMDDAKKVFSDSKNWPGIIRKWMKEGNDPNINAVIKAILNDLDPPRLVKAWSLLDFFIKDHPDKLVEAIGKMRADLGDNGERAIKEVFGWTLEELDGQWRTWAKRKY